MVYFFVPVRGYNEAIWENGCSKKALILNINGQTWFRDARNALCLAGRRKKKGACLLFLHRGSVNSAIRFKKKEFGEKSSGLR